MARVIARYSFRFGFARLGAMVAVFVAFCSAAYAQPSGDLQAQYDAAFQEMLKKPADLDVLFKFAAVASQTGDLEGAVSALERMLIIDPNLPRVRLELGVLYYRLASYEVARTYLEGALQSAECPGRRTEQGPGVPRAGEQAAQPVALQRRGFLRSALPVQRQSRPCGLAVRLFGQVANLNQAALGASDWGAVGSAQVRHVYDFGLQDGSQLESNFTAYGNRQFQVTQANIALLDLNTGPRFRAFRNSFEDVTFRPFLTLGYVWVNDTPYYGSYGAGMETGVLLSDRLRNTSIVSWRELKYQDSSYLPQNSLFTGLQLSASTNFQYKVTDAVTAYVFGNAQRYLTAQAYPWQSYMLEGVGAALSYRFIDPIFKSQLPWNVTLSVAQQWWQYDAPDPTIDPNTGRAQSDTILSLVLSIPINERITLSVSGGRFNRAATVPNYAFANNDFMAGLSWRF